LKKGDFMMKRREENLDKNKEGKKEKERKPLKTNKRTH